MELRKKQEKCKITLISPCICGLLQYCFAAYTKLSRENKTAKRYVTKLLSGGGHHILIEHEVLCTKTVDLIKMVCTYVSPTEEVRQRQQAASFLIGRAASDPLLRWIRPPAPSAPAPQRATRMA